MKKPLPKKKIALVYDRVNKWGGAERVLLTLHEMFPDAPLYTSVYDAKSAPWAKVFPEVRTSFLQKIPFAKSNHEFLAPLMPLAFESFNFSKFDLVISVTSEAAKGIITTSKTFHLCYCLTPTRYLWSGRKFYFESPPSKFSFIPFFKFLSTPFIKILERWDIESSKRPDKMVAISTEVQNRTQKYYKRESEIIFPPVDIAKTKERRSKNKIGDYYLLVNRLIPYKRADLAVKAFNKLRDPLYIVGSGSEEMKLKKIAARNVKFLGQVNEKELNQLYLRTKALIMPQEEDFGIVAVEAQSFGVPVIAYKKGGSLDTVIEGKTGIFFEKQTVKSLMQAVKKFDKMSFSERILKENAKRFSKTIFKKQLQRSLIRAYLGWRRRNSPLAKI
jgi:glycosyltransferase involved in cell wall biosynthesis